MTKQEDYEEFTQDLKEYFDPYEFISVSLINLIVDSCECYPRIRVESFLEDVSVSVEFYVLQCLKLKDIDKGNEVSFDEIWRYLHIQSMKNFQLSRNMLLKEIDKKTKEVNVT